MSMVKALLKVFPKAMRVGDPESNGRLPVDIIRRAHKVTPTGETLVALFTGEASAPTLVTHLRARGSDLPATPPLADVSTSPSRTSRQRWGGCVHSLRR